MNNFKHNNVPIMSLLGISLAVHVVVFFVIHYFSINNSVLSIIPPYQPGSLSVALESPKTSVRHIESKQKMIPALFSSKKSVSEKNNKTLNSDKNITEITLQNKLQSKSQQNKALLIRQVRSEISHYFDYPMFARRKGWQGTVLLEFNVSHTGYINNIKVKNSSGYDILDRAAQKSLLHVQRIKVALNNDLPLNTRLQVPVIYQLTKG